MFGCTTTPRCGYSKQLRPSFRDRRIVLRSHNLYPSVAQAFISGSPKLRSAGTRKKWLGTLRRLQERYPTKRANELTLDDLVDFLTLDEEGKRRTWAPNTLASNRNTVSQCFRYAARHGFIEHDLSANLIEAVPVKPSNRRLGRWLNETELQALFATCLGNDPADQRDLILLLFGALLGLRRAEIVNVRWSDFDPDFRTLTVTGKGEKTAQLQVPPVLIDVLRAWYDRFWLEVGRAPSVEHVLPKIARSEILTKPNAPRSGPRIKWATSVSGTVVTAVVKARALEAGLGDLAPHDLRRTFAGLHDNRDVPIQRIRAMMRHSSSATTDRYLEANPGRVQQAQEDTFAFVSLSRGDSPEYLRPNVDDRSKHGAVRPVPS